MTTVRDSTRGEEDRVPTLYDHIMNLHERIVRLEAMVMPGVLTTNSAIIGWNYDPTICVAPTLIGNPRLSVGVGYYVRVPLNTVSPVTNVHFTVALAGNVSAAHCAVFDASGTKIGANTNLVSAFNSAGAKTIALTTPTASRVDHYVWVAFLVVSVNLLGSGPSIAQAAADPDVTAAPSALARYATAGSGRATIPDALPTLVASDQTLWVGLS